MPTIFVFQSMYGFSLTYCLKELGRQIIKDRRDIIIRTVRSMPLILTLGKTTSAVRYVNCLAVLLCTL